MTTETYVIRPARRGVRSVRISPAPDALSRAARLALYGAGLALAAALLRPALAALAFLLAGGSL